MRRTLNLWLLSRYLILTSADSILHSVSFVQTTHFFAADFNECDSNPCQNGGTCHNLRNHYKCNCTVGYDGVNCTHRKFVFQNLLAYSDSTTPITQSHWSIFPHSYISIWNSLPPGVPIPKQIQQLKLKPKHTPVKNHCWQHRHIPACFPTISS